MKDVEGFVAAVDAREGSIICSLVLRICATSDSRSSGREPFLFMSQMRRCTRRERLKVLTRLRTTSLARSGTLELRESLSSWIMAASDGAQRQAVERLEITLGILHAQVDLLEQANDHERFVGHLAKGPWMVRSALSGLPTLR